MLPFKEDTNPDRQETIRQFHAESKVRRAADDAVGKPGLLAVTRHLDSLPDGNHIAFGVPIAKIGGGYQFADGRTEIAAFGAAGSLRRYYWKPESETVGAEPEIASEPAVTETAETVPTVSVVIPRHGRFRYGERKGWAKAITGLDESQNNGYAFLGEWLDRGAFRRGQSFELPIGTVVMSYGEETGRRWWPEVGLYVVRESGLERIGFSEEHTWAHDLKSSVKKALSDLKKS